MNAQLVAEEGLLKGLVLPFENGEEWIIGRDPEACQLLLEDPAASRRHLLCRNTPLGITIENLSTTNPVQVNDQELIGSHLLQDGDAIRIGSGLFRYFVSTPNSLREQPKEEEPEPEEKEEAAPFQVIPPPASLVPDEETEEKYDSILQESTEAISKHSLAEINFDIAEEGRWLLKVISGPNNGAEFSMQEGTSYLIGTDPNACDIVFHDTSVSRQHARISIDNEGNISIEDQGSRNGIFVDGQQTKEKVPLPLNTVVNLGTSSFVVYDREGNMQTIISPLLPSIVKVLQREPGQEPPQEEAIALTPPETKPAAAPTAPPKERSIGPLILLGAITGLFILAAVGTTTLFKSQPAVVAKQVVDTDKILGDTFTPYPSLKYSFNKTNGRLVIFGHLLTAQDKIQLMYNLQALPFIKSLDDSGVIIDEYVWREMNQVLSKNPEWRTINLHSPTAGRFVLTGNLETRAQADQLYDYISTNFPYLDRLEKNVTIDEEVADQVRIDLEKVQLNIKTAFKNGELTISGGIPQDKQILLNDLVEEFRNIPGVRSIKLLTTAIAPNMGMEDISASYEVTGFSQVGNTISVIVNGRIVAKGDVIDGMRITDIAQHTIYLEYAGVKYVIHF